MSWAERAADRSPVVQRSRSRGVEQAKSIVEAARRLIAVKGPSFTTQELVKEAGIALQTFYRYFPGKDHLLLAVIEDIIDEACQEYEKAAAKIRDPVERLRSYITSAVASLTATGGGPQFITVEHWRLQALYPEEVSRATRPFTNLILTEIEAATSAGQLHPSDPEYSAWLVTQLTMAVFHHYDSAGLSEPADLIADRLWSFCFGALGGSANQADPGGRVRTRRGKA
jgi:AcrR family transcriptional regulator